VILCDSVILISSSLVVTDWRGEDVPAVDEVAVQLQQHEERLSSSLFSVMEKLSQKVQLLEDNMSYPPPVQVSISAIMGKRFSAQERGYRGYKAQSTLWFYQHDHDEDMRKWDGKATSNQEA